MLSLDAVSVWYLLQCRSRGSDGKALRELANGSDESCGDPGVAAVRFWCCPAISIHSATTCSATALRPLRFRALHFWRVP